jgi:hypothetical protein
LVAIDRGIKSKGVLEKAHVGIWRKGTHKITLVNSKSLIAGAIQLKLIHI